MRNLFNAFTILCLLSSHALLSQDVGLDWLAHAEGDSIDFGEAIAINSEGEVYAAGGFVGTADFDSGPGTAIFTSAGFFDGIIQKLDANGNFIWAKQLVGSSSVLINAISLDLSGNIYLTGYFWGTVDFDPGTEELNLMSTGWGADIFILKMDSMGDFIWVKQIGGPLDDLGKAIALDDAGNVFVTGQFRESVDFDPGEGVSELTSNGSRDGFVLKLDTNGDFLWVKQIGGVSSVSGSSISLDGSGNIYTSGSFAGIIDVDPESGVADLTSVGGQDIFIQKLDANGDFVWGKQIGGDLEDEYAGGSTSLDAQGNIYISGGFEGAVDFDPGPETFVLSSAGSRDVFVQKLNTDGDFVWAHQFGGDDFDIGIATHSDAVGNTYTSGTFHGDVDFNPGLGISILSSAENSDVFIQKLNSNGDFLWVKQFEGPSHIAVGSIDVDNSGNVFATGSFWETIDFSPGTGMDSYTSAGYEDIFVLKLSACDLTTFVLDVANLPMIEVQCAVTPVAPTANNGCSTYAGTTIVEFPITTIGTTTILWTYDDGAGNTLSQSQDIVITPDITAPVPDAMSLLEISALCEILEEDVLAPTAMDNCSDEIIATSDLIFPITDQSITEIVWTYDDGNGNVMTQIQTINWTPVDVATSLIGLTITALNSNGEFQWVDCDNNNAQLDGEDGQSFTATSNGNYAVEITEDGCTETSECVSIMTVGLNEIELDATVLVYPNPSSDLFNIEFENVIDNAVFTVTDIKGRLISTTQIQNSAKTSVEIHEAPGIYLLTIKTSEGQKTIQLIKE